MVVTKPTGGVDREGILRKTQMKSLLKLASLFVQDFTTNTNWEDKNRRCSSVPSTPRILSNSMERSQNFTNVSRRSFGGHGDRSLSVAGTNKGTDRSIDQNRKKGRRNILRQPRDRLSIIMTCFWDFAKYTQYNRLITHHPPTDSETETVWWGSSTLKNQEPANIHLQPLPLRVLLFRFIQPKNLLGQHGFLNRLCHSLPLLLLHLLHSWIP